MGVHRTAIGRTPFSRDRAVLRDMLAAFINNFEIIS